MVVREGSVKVWAMLASVLLPETAGCRFLFLAVDADDETLRARLRARAGTASTSDAREDLLPWLRRHYEPPVELDPTELLPVDGRAPAAAIVDAVRERVGAPA